MSLKEPIVFSIAHRTWCINEFGMDAMFLLEGDDKALLIDTGTGVFDIPALVKKYTDKPVTVALTHGHVDHAGGISWFREVHLHRDDFNAAKAITTEERQGYVARIMSQSEGLYDLTPQNVMNGKCEPALVPLQDGDVISLGGRDVSVYETPGHTLGCLSFLDETERILFTGDACNQNTLLVCSAKANSKKGTMSALLHTAKKIEGLRRKYDRNYNGHIGYAANITNLNPMPERLTRDCIELCEKLLHHEQQGVEVQNPIFGKCLLARNKTMQIVYTKDQVK